jgi:uncharacterized protein (DUF697 family)
MALNRVQKAHLIIHTCAAGAAAWSAMWAYVPVVGPLLADSFGLTCITVAMTGALAMLFDKKPETSAVWSFATVVLGGIFGSVLLKAAWSLVPIYGSGVNATITFGLHEATGWGLFLIFNEGGDLPKTREEWKTMMERGKSKAADEKDSEYSYKNMMSKLPEEERRRIEVLQAKLTQKDITEEQTNAVLAEIEAIVSKYN